MIKMSVLALFIVLLFSSNQVGAQDVNIISGNQSNQTGSDRCPRYISFIRLGRNGTG